jgi:hypothetical protein
LKNVCMQETRLEYRISGNEGLEEDATLRGLKMVEESKSRKVETRIK